MTSESGFPPVEPKTQIIGLALHEKRRHTGQQPGTKSGRRPAVKPRINRLSTVGQPAIVFPHSIYIGFVVWCFRRGVQDSCLRCPGSSGGQGGRLSPGRTVPSASCPARPCPAPPPRRARTAPTRRWYVRVLDSTGIPRAGRPGAGHSGTEGRGGARQGAAWRGGTGRGGGGSVISEDDRPCRFPGQWG